MSSDCEMNIAVCDDLECDRDRTITMTRQILQDAHIPHSITGFTGSRGLLSAIQAGNRFHLLLLDVMMDEMDGMELAARLRDQGDQTAIVFISGNREMALRGYRVSAVRYLAKPVDQAELQEALLYCYQVWHAEREILLPTNRGQHRMSVTDIQYVEAFDRGTRFILTEETVETKLKFSDVEAMLPKSAFIHCHRAFIVNIAHTKRIRQYAFDMKSGDVVPISRPRYSEVNRKFVEYITE